ncbi:hypothetical protein [Geodermatophilus sp. URMC 64]
MTGAVREPLPRVVAPWPYGSGRPGVATAAAWTAFVLAGGAGLVGLLAATGWAAEPDPLLGVAALALPWGVGLAAGGVLLLRRRGRRLLLVSALGLFAVVAAACAVDPELRSDGVAGVAAALILYGAAPGALVLLAAQPRVGSWLTGVPPAGPLPYAPPPFGWPPYAWPYGSPRPWGATAAAALAFVGAALVTAVVTFDLGLNLADRFLVEFSLVQVLALPCAAGLVVGGVRLLRRRGRGTLVLSALGVVAVSLAAEVVAVATGYGVGPTLPDAAVGLPLPVLASICARQPVVGTWLDRA